MVPRVMPGRCALLRAMPPHWDVTDVGYPDYALPRFIHGLGTVGLRLVIYAHHT